MYVRTENTGIRTAQAHRGHRAPALPPPGTTLVPVGAIRAETQDGEWDALDWRGRMGLWRRWAETKREDETRAPLRDVGASSPGEIRCASLSRGYHPAVS